VIDVFRHNREAWNRAVAEGNRWTVPVSPEEIAQARVGRWEILLTPTTPVPLPWFGRLEGAEVLCLASGGGQQGPVLAAAGARVTVLDASPAQLARDREVADREGLELRTVEGDMADLSDFPENAFDLIVHPVSNCFVPDLRPVWREAARVLRVGGALLAGVTNPVLYLCDDDEVAATGVLTVRHRIPYSDLEQLPAERLAAARATAQPLEFGHTLADQLGGQLEAGLVLTHLYEDRFDGDHPLSRHIATFIATRAVKLAHRGGPIS
jgi:SAM-dependent methyltransferase